MGTNYIAPIWRMPRNANKDKLSNYSINIGAAGEYIDTNTSLDTSYTSLTLSAWVKYDSLINYEGTLFGQWITNAFSNSTLLAYIEPSGSNKLFKVYWGPTTSNPLTSTTVLQTDVWYHIVITWDGNNIKLFINGTEEDSQVKTSINNSTQTLKIGAYINASQTAYIGELNGQVSQACLFDYALTDGTGGTTDQIGYLYNLNNPMAITGAEPVAYWPLGDNSNPNAPGSFPNISVGADSVFDFENSDQDYINLGAEPIVTGVFTTSMWIKRSSLTPNNVSLFAKDDTSSNRVFHAHFVNSSNVIAFWVSPTGAYDANYRVQTTTPISDLNWHHVVFINKGNNVQNEIWIDGQEASYSTQGTGTSTLYNSSAVNTVIGAHSTLTNRTFNGEISNVQFWDTDLQNSDIATLYNNGQPLMTGTQPQEANLKAWYKLNQSSNWEADTAGNWQIPDAVSAYPQSFDGNGTGFLITKTGDEFDISTKFSFSLWLNMQTIVNYDHVFGASNGNWTEGFGLLQDGSSGTLRFWVDQWNTGGKFVQTDTTLDTSKWYHICGTFDNTNGGLLYVDGQVQNSGVAFTAASLTSIDLNKIIRIFGTTSGYTIDALISNFQLWNTELSSSQVETLYNNGIPLTTAIATNNLKAWYKLDNTEKYLQTYLNIRNSWVVKNNFQDVNYNSALYMDGTNANRVSVDSSTNLEITGSHSFSLWVFYDDYSATSYIFDKGGLDYALQIAGVSPRIIYYGYTRSGGGTGNHITLLPGNWSNTIHGNDNTWHHVVITTDITAKTIRYYLDGEEQGNGFALPSDFAAVRTSSGKLTMMTYEGGAYPSRGLISNFAIYNGSVLSPSEVTALYNNSTPEVTPSITPTSWWKLNNLTTGLIDNINGDNATNTGSTVKEIPVQATAGVSSGMTGKNLVNNNVSVLNGESANMNTNNLVTSNISRKQPYSNYSFNFDSASSDYIEVPNNDSFNFVNTNFSISIWLNPDVSHNGIVMSHYSGSNGWGMYYQSGSIRFYDAPVWTTFTTINTNEWTHILIVGDYSGGNLICYKNGIEVYNSSHTFSITDANINLFIASERGTGFFYDGKISNTCLFDRALTEQEALKIYNNGVAQDLQATSSFSNNIIAWWPMDEHSSYYDGTDWVVRDIENGNDGDGANTGNVNDLVGNAPGSDANGSGNNLAIADLKGNMYNSDKNAYSINMADYADGVTNPANSGRSTDTP